MKKKKQQTPAILNPNNNNKENKEDDNELKSLINSHASFFDNLIELIPAKFYLSTDDNDQKTWFQGLSKAAKASAKHQTRLNIKQARRDRLDPRISQNNSTLSVLKHKVHVENNKTAIDIKDESESVTYEELQKRLRAKMQELRANRGQGKRSMITDRGDRTRKREEEDYVGVEDDKIEKEVEEASKGIEFGKLRVEEEEGREGKRKKGSKSRELERAKKLEEAKRDPEKGGVVAEKHSWKAATSRAMGVKVHDDARILKESLKKERKRAEKSAGKWKERVESQEKVRSDKEKKRAGNIRDRAEQKKARKIAKREKKLMRPGFEGRRDGYINAK